MFLKHFDGANSWNIPCRVSYDEESTLEDAYCAVPLPQSARTNISDDWNILSMTCGEIFPVHAGATKKVTRTATKRRCESVA